MLLALLKESYPSELARQLGATVPSVQQILNRLEDQNVIVGTTVGKMRRVELNRRFPGYEALLELLKTLAELDPAVRQAAESLRRSPRRRGKAL